MSDKLRFAGVLLGLGFLVWAAVWYYNEYVK